MLQPTLVSGGGLRHHWQRALSTQAQAMLRVVMLSTDLERGGLPLRVVRLALRLRDADVLPIVGCLTPPGPLTSELESAGIETFSCEGRGRFDGACLLALARHLRRLDPDLIHSSLFHANLAARLVGRLDRARPIVTGTVTIEVARRWHRWLESLTFDRSDLHVANSQAVAAHLCEELGFSPERVAVVPNGVALEEIDLQPAIRREALGLPDGIPLVVWAGRMDPVKDLQTFVGVISALRSGGEVRAVILGDGAERPRIERLVGERELDDVIRMARWSTNVIGWLKAADLLLFPSLTEGSPNVVIEAMACRCPVVASDIPSCRELIEDGVHGWLRPAGDVRRFAVLMTSLLSNAALRQSTVAAARQRVVERHDMRRVVERWRSIYGQVMSDQHSDR
jgi:glycosyltransferase involved in cell wall biosynthesis